MHEILKTCDIARLVLKKLICLLKPFFSEQQTHARKYEIYISLKGYFKEAASK